VAAKRASSKLPEGGSTARELEPSQSPEHGRTGLSRQLPRELTEKTPERSSAEASRASLKARRPRLESPPFKESRAKLIIPAMAVGLVSGVALSAYLFWSQPAADKAAASNAPAATQPRPARKPVTVSKPGGQTKRTSTTAGLAPKAKPKPAPRSDAAWQATIRAQGDRLRSEAENRFNTRLNAMRSGATPEPATLPVTVPEPEPGAAAPVVGLTTDTTTPAVPTGMDTAARTEQPDTRMPLEDPAATIEQVPDTGDLPAPAPEMEFADKGAPTETGTVNLDTAFDEQPENNRPDTGDTPVPGGGSTELF
jgi:hypothetical protein